ncbi:hypothetical protein [uncultured Clostridium sp.]|nr:hypothetical protein [uncultured Clostridium sp.]
MKNSIKQDKLKEDRIKVNKFTAERMSRQNKKATKDVEEIFKREIQ